MPFTTTRKKDGVTIIDLTGKIEIGVGAVALRAAVQEALDSGAKKILVNLAGVTAIDSSGVGELLASRQTVVDRGGKLKLTSLSPRAHNVLALTNLITVLDVYDNESEAVASFK